MEILGIGPLELVLILVIALLVFGPDKLPDIGAKLGRSVRELRTMSREITQNVNTLVNEPVAELRQPIDEASQVVQSIAKTADTVRNPAEALQKAIAGQLSVPATPPAPPPESGDATIAPPRAEQANEPAAVEPAANTPAPAEAAIPPLEAEMPPAPTDQHASASPSTDPES